MKRLMQTPDDTAALIARITLGVVIFPHGAQKLLGWFGGHGPSETLHAFTSWGFPGFLVVLLIATESVGSLLLVLGFLGRVWAAAIGVVMLVAIGWLHWRVGFFMNWYGTQRGEGFEYHLLALGLAAIVIVRGSGRWSIDRRLAPSVR